MYVGGLSVGLQIHVTQSWTSVYSVNQGTLWGNIYLTAQAYVIEMTSSFRVYRQKFCLHFASPISGLKLVLSWGRNRVGVPFTSPEDGNSSSFPNVVFLAIQNTGQWTKSRSPVIQSVIHRRYQYRLNESSLIPNEGDT
jgi:hypothetical protein